MFVCMHVYRSYGSGWTMLLALGKQHIRGGRTGSQCESVEQVVNRRSVLQDQREAEDKGEVRGNQQGVEQLECLGDNEVHIVQSCDSLIVWASTFCCPPSPSNLSCCGSWWYECPRKAINNKNNLNYYIFSVVSYRVFSLSSFVSYHSNVLEYVFHCCRICHLTVLFFANYYLLLLTLLVNTEILQQTLKYDSMAWYGSIVVR